MKSTSWSSGLSVAADGTGVVAHAGGVAVRLLADRVGLTGALSNALARRSFTPVHDRGRVLVDVATMLAGGGEAIADIAEVRDEGRGMGRLAFVGMVSEPHAWGSELGELQLAIWRRQFAALRDGDRLFYLNDLAVLNGIRDGLGVDFRRTLAQIIRDNVPGAQVADDVFEAVE